MDKEIQIIKNKERLGCILFEIGVVLELLVMMTDSASWTLPLRGRITQVAFALFVIKILMTKYNMRQVILGGIAGIIGVISYLSCHEEYVIRAVIFVVAAIGVDLELTLKIIFWGMLVCTLVIVALSLLGIRGEIKDVRDYGRGGAIEARYCLGFNHANNVHSVLWYLMALMIMRFKDKLNALHYLLMAVFSICLYIFTLSRTGLMATLVILVLGVAARYIAGRENAAAKFADADARDSKASVVVDILGAIGSFSALALSLAITIRSGSSFPYTSDFMYKLDRVLTGRVEMVWEHTPLSEWGFFPPVRSAEFVDNGFAVIGYTYGYIVLGLLIASIIYASVYLCRKHLIYAQIVLLSAIMLTFMEATFIFNVSLLCNMLLIVYICGNEESIG